MALENLRDHLLNAVAVATVLGGGTAILTNRVDIARHDERIARIEKLDGRMETLSGELKDTQVAIAKLGAAR